MNIVVLDNSEKFLTIIDPDLVDITETFSDGLRSIDVKYNIEEFVDAKTYFQSGHKIFIVGDENLTDCLYVLNTTIKQDLFKENVFSFTAEEVLVELNYAPYFSQTELTSDNGFTISTASGKQTVTINYNALRYFFGDYFNIGIVQDCISTYISKITLSGTMSLMSLLRYIEEETGNVFITRYEKDVLTNTIHRYLDFLNPVSQNKNWSCTFEYDFYDLSVDEYLEYDENDNAVTPETTDIYEDDDIVTFMDYEELSNLDPSTLQFRFTDGTNILTDDNDTELVWNASDCGLVSTDNNVFIKLTYKNSVLGVKIENKNYKVYSETTVGGREISFITIDDDPTETYTGVLPTTSYFEFYDSANDKVVYSRIINPVLNEPHEEILDLGYNVENIEFELDESDTYTAIAPVLSLSSETTTEAGVNNSLSRTDLDTIITRWVNLSVTKGDTIPMIVQKVNITAESYAAAKTRLGTYAVDSNYYRRPLKPQDNTDSDNNNNNSYEFWRGTAFWNAPFTKNRGEMHISLDSNDTVTYPAIRCRPDHHVDRKTMHTPKIGPVETSDEDVYAIYNDVAMKLKDKKDPKFTVTVDVANLKDGKFNDYNVYDKVYVKLPDSEELVTAEVVKTVKDLHNMNENKVTLDNYSINTKEITKETYIQASNISFKYPKSKNLTVTLKDATNSNAMLKGKLISFVLYKVDDTGSTTLTRKVYTKKTNSNGQATITCKYDPGNYEIQIQFVGDAEYSESNITIEVNVSGKKQKKKTTSSSNKSTKKTTTKKKYKTVKRYYDKFGRSPDKKTIRAVGLPSRSGEVSKYGYKYITAEFKNKCPGCGHDSLLWGWHFGTYFNGRREGGSAEGHFFCSRPQCDMDFSVTGQNHNGSGKPTMKRIGKVKYSSKSDAYKLTHGKYLYDTQKIEIKEKNNTSNKNRTVVGNVSYLVKQKALAIVGNSQGLTAAKKIAAWMDKNIHYSGYYNFQRSAKTSLQKRYCNCCDGTRLFFELCDAAGCTEFLDLWYVHVTGHVYAYVKTKATGNWRYVDNASTLPAWGYVCRGYARGSPTSKYPNLPF